MDVDTLPFDLDFVPFFDSLSGEAQLFLINLIASYISGQIPYAELEAQLLQMAALPAPQRNMILAFVREHEAAARPPAPEPSTMHVDAPYIGPSYTEIIQRDIAEGNQPVTWTREEEDGVEPADRAKLAFIRDVDTTFKRADANKLVHGYATGQITFLEAATLLPALFQPVPAMIERFGVLTDHAEQKQRLVLLSMAIHDLKPLLGALSNRMKAAVYEELVQLIINDRMPEEQSPTREFTHFAAQRALPSMLPPFHGQPRILSTIPPQPTTSKQTQPESAPTGRANRASQNGGHDGRAVTASAPPQGPANGDSTTTRSSQPPSDTTPLLIPSTTADAANASNLLTLGTGWTPYAFHGFNTPHHASSSSFATVHYGPSYTQRPSTYVPPICSGRDELGDEVLNDYFHCAGSGSEGSAQDSIRNPYEESLFHMEEDALSIDIQVGRLQSTVRTLQEIQTRLNIFQQQGVVKFENIWGELVRLRSVADIISNSLLPTHVDSLKQVVKNRTSVAVDMLGLFNGEPAKFITEMSRLCMWHADELIRMRRAFGKLWNHTAARQYIHVLDHRSYRAQRDDKHHYNPKALLAQLNYKHYESATAGVLETVDHHETIDLSHFRLDISPPLTNSKSERHSLEELQHTDPSMTSVPRLANDLPEELAPRIQADLSALLMAGGERLLKEDEMQDMSHWLEETFVALTCVPDAADWSPDAPSAPPAELVVCMPPQFYVVTRLYFLLYERLRLAYYLAETFNSVCWDFARVKPPPKPEMPPAPASDFPLVPPTSTNPSQPDVDTFDTHPPTPMFELSEMYVESNPDYLALWEAEAAPATRMTRAGASTSAGLLGGAPPLANTVIPAHLTRLAAQIRANPLTTTAMTTEGIKPISYASVTTATAASEEEQANSPPLPDPDLRLSLEEKYPRFLELVKAIIAGRMEPGAFELACLKILGPEAFPLFTIHRIITATVYQIRTMMTLPGRQEWYRLWGRYGRKNIDNTLKAKDAQDSRVRHAKAQKEYISSCCKLAGTNKFIILRVLPTCVMTIKMMSGVVPSFQSGLGGLLEDERYRLAWEAYVRTWNSPGNTNLNIPRHGMLLKRNLACGLPKELQLEAATSAALGRTPSWPLYEWRLKYQYFHLNSGSCRAIIDVYDYKFSIEIGTTHWERRLRRRVFPPTPPHSVTARKPFNPRSPLHTICANLLEQVRVREIPAPRLDKRAEIDRIEEIIQAEMNRPDHVEPTVAEPLASRAHPRGNHSPSMVVDDQVEEDAQSDSSQASYESTLIVC